MDEIHQFISGILRIRRRTPNVLFYLEFFSLSIFDSHYSTLASNRNPKRAAQECQTVFAWDADESLVALSTCSALAEATENADDCSFSPSSSAPASHLSRQY